MSILVNKDTRLLVQGFTGSQGPYSEQSIEYGTNIVGGVTPEKWSNSSNKPVFNSVKMLLRSLSQTHQ